jgi:molybdopterin synthase sulfur carrier subunit
MEVKVLFFGVLTEVTGTAVKHYRDVKSIGSLKLRLNDDYPEIIHFDFRIALNNEMINSDHELNEGDEVALMPPFAGG